MFFYFPNVYVNTNRWKNSFNYVQVKEAGFFDIWTEQWFREDLVYLVYVFINLCRF